MEVERTELANVQGKIENGPSVDGRQRLFTNHLMLGGMETFLVVNDKGKTGT